MSRKGIVILAIGLILIAAGVYLYHAIFDVNIIIDSIPANPIPISSVTTIPSKISDPNVTTFVSQKLGVRFSYLKEQGNEKVAAQEVGNKIYVYSTNSPATQGQYVEVWDKPATESLKGAIQRQFLNTSNPKECFVQASGYKTRGAQWELAEIGVPRTEDEGMDVLFERWKKCPTPYTTENGIAFFAMDKNHPTKLLFFNIGQYGISASDNTSWQDTLEVF